MASTNDTDVLRIDVLATDVYSSPAHPTLLYFNPHTNRPVWVAVVSEACRSGQLRDIFDVTSSRLLARAVDCAPGAGTTTATIKIAADMPC